MGRTRQLERELTPRQREVLDLLARGHTNAEIGERLGITLAGAKWHVSELLDKLDANTREELAERWLAQRRPAQRVRRWLGGVAAFSPFKLSAATVVGATAAVASIGVAVGVIALRDGEGSGPGAAVVAVAADTPTPGATPLPVATLPAAPGAIWTAQEALDHALVEINQRLGSRESIGSRLANPPVLGAGDLVEADWLPGITRFDATDGDRYWDPDDKLTHDIWHFRWEVPGVPVTELQAPTATLTAEILVRDGSTGEPPAYEVLVVAPGVDRGVGGGGGFRSREQDEMRRVRTEPISPATRVAWFNNEVGSAWLGAYPTASGNWCLAEFTSTGERTSGSCSFAPGRPLQALSFSWGFAVSPGGVMGEVSLDVTVSEDVGRLEVLHSDGRQLSFAVSPGPPQLNLGRGFAYLGIGTMADTFTVVAFDANGVELARESRDRPGPPPPPPPTRAP